MTTTQKLKWIRKKHEETQQDIADILHTSQQYYSKYENGVRPITVDHLRTLCDHYQVSADYILGLPDDLWYPKLE